MLHAKSTVFAVTCCVDRNKNSETLGLVAAVLIRLYCASLFSAFKDKYDNFMVAVTMS